MAEALNILSADLQLQEEEEMAGAVRKLMQARRYNSEGPHNC